MWCAVLRCRPRRRAVSASATARPRRRPTRAPRDRARASDACVAPRSPAARGIAHAAGCAGRAVLLFHLYSTHLTEFVSFVRLASSEPHSNKRRCTRRHAMQCAFASPRCGRRGIAGLSLWRSARSARRRRPTRSSSTTCSDRRSRTTTASLNWAKRVEERTKGGLKIEVFHSAQLGKEEDIIEQIRQGANIGPEHRLGAPGQLRAGHGGDERPVLRRDAGRGGQAAQGAQRHQVAGRTRSKHGLKVRVLQLGAGLPPLLHQQAGAQARRPQGPAHPHAAGADLAGVGPRARRHAGGDGLRRDVPGACSRRRSTASSWSTTTSPAAASTKCSSSPTRRGTSC